MDRRAIDERPSLTFTLTARDLAAGGLVAASAREGRTILPAVIVSIAALGLPVVAVRYGAPLLGWLALVPILVTVHLIPFRRSVGYRAWWQRLVWRRAGLPPTTRLAVTLGQDWLRVVSRDNSAGLRWRGVCQVLRDRGVIVVTQTPGCAWLVVPESAFPSGPACDEFHDSILGHWTAATRPEAAGAAEPDATQTTGAPA